MRADKASVVTKIISAVTETGIQFASVQTLEIDIIVTATGFKLKIAGGARISVDNVPVTIIENFLWKSVMLQHLPKITTVIGYTNADATALLVCRLLKAMTAKGVALAAPCVEDTKTMKSAPALNLLSTYVVRGAKELPKQEIRSHDRRGVPILWIFGVKRLPH